LSGSEDLSSVSEPLSTTVECLITRFSYSFLLKADIIHWNSTIALSYHLGKSSVSSVSVKVKRMTYSYNLTWRFGRTCSSFLPAITPNNLMFWM